MNAILDIQDKILELINSNTDDIVIKSDQIDEDLTLLGMDSIAFMKIVIAMEEAFEIEIPDEKLLITEMGTINKMIDVISTTLGLQTNEKR